MKLASISHLLIVSIYLLDDLIKTEYSKMWHHLVGRVFPDLWKQCSGSPTIQELIELTDPEDEGTMILCNNRNYSHSNKEMNCQQDWCENLIPCMHFGRSHSSDFYPSTVIHFMCCNLTNFLRDIHGAYDAERKTTLFRVVGKCSLVHRYQHFWRICWHDFHNLLITLQFDIM